MFTRLRHHRLSLAGLLLQLLSCFTVGADPNPSGHERSKQDRIKVARKERDTTVFFTGDVRDQHGIAVENAVVTAHVRHFAFIPPFFMAMTNISVETDKKGTFVIKDTVGSDLFIKEIWKYGYEFNLEDNRTAFYYKGAEGEEVFRPDEENPVKFVLRKNGESVFLFEDRGGPMLERPQSSIAFNFVEERVGRGNDAPDLVVSSVYQEEHEAYDLVFQPQGEGSGIVVADHVTYGAPERGYRPQYATTVKLGEQLPRKTLYIKSRDASIYTRMDVGFFPRREFMRLDFRAWTNPYGERNLEPELEMPFSVMKRLRDEARLALRKKTYPKKPDLKALIEAEKVR